MNNKELKIVKFAITQDNIELLKFAITQDKLNENQLAECLLLAKDKPNCYQELTNLISDNTPETIQETKENEETYEVQQNEETSEETPEAQQNEETPEKTSESQQNEENSEKTSESQENEETTRLEKKMKKERDGHSLHYLVRCNVNFPLRDPKMIRENLWTKEALEYESDNYGTILHYLARYRKSSTRALEYLEKAVSLYPEGCLRKSKKYGNTPLALAICENNFVKFKIIWNAVETNKIEIGEDFEEGILKYIIDNVKVRDICQYVYQLIFSNKLKFHQKDIEKIGAIMHKVLYETPTNSLKLPIIHRLLELDGASEKLLDYRWKDKYSNHDASKSFNHIFSLEEEAESIVEILLKSNRFFLYLEKDKDLIIKYPLLIQRFLKYCPKNIVNDLRRENKPREYPGLIASYSYTDVDYIHSYYLCNGYN